MVALFIFLFQEILLNNKAPDLSIKLQLIYSYNSETTPIILSLLKLYKSVLIIVRL